MLLKTKFFLFSYLRCGTKLIAVKFCSNQLSLVIGLEIFTTISFEISFLNFSPFTKIGLYLALFFLMVDSLDKSFQTPVRLSKEQLIKMIGKRININNLQNLFIANNIEFPFNFIFVQSNIVVRN